MTKHHSTEAILFDIIDAAKNCILFTNEMTLLSLEQDIKTTSAVLHQLMILGEAAKRMDAEFCSKHPSVPWKKMAQTRDILIHHYEGVDLNIVWNIVKGELPQIIDEIGVLLGEQ